MPIISVEDARFRYAGETDWALQGVTFEVRRGEILCVLGGEAAGKSTLCKLLNGLVPHSVRGELLGEVRLDGKPTNDLPPPQIVRRVGHCLQDPDVQLFTASVEEEVAYGPENLGLDPGEIEGRVSWALEVMGLGRMREKSPAALSGGQKQRLAIASVLSMLPDVLVLDEPLSMLDPVGRRGLLELLSGLARQRRMAVVMTEQDAEEIAGYCDRLLLLSHGCILAGDGSDLMKAGSEGLISAGVKPPELLLLSEELLRSGLLDSGQRFVDEGSAERAVGPLLTGG